MFMQPLEGKRERTMKSVVGWLLLLVMLVGMAAVGLHHFRRTTREQAYALSLDAIKEDFQTQAAGLQLLEPDAYHKELSVLLSRYFSRLNTLAHTYPECYDPARERTLVEKETARGRLSPEQRAERLERIDHTLALFEKLRSGHYQPMDTRVDKTFRFDVESIEPARVASEDRLKLSYLHWGAFGPVSYRLIKGDIRTADVDAHSDKTKRYQIMAEDQPPALQIEPQRWVREFIPGVEIGYYDLPRLPPNAQSMQLRFDMTIRTVGGTSVPVSMVFAEMNAPDAWKVRPGEQWNAKELITDEETPEDARAHLAQ